MRKKKKKKKKKTKKERGKNPTTKTTKTKEKRKKRREDPILYSQYIILISIQTQSLHIFHPHFLQFLNLLKFFFVLLEKYVW